MSRIGLKPVNLPAGVEVKVDDNNLVTVKGPKGELQEQISSLITVEQKDGVLTVSRDGDEKEKREQHGLARALINNMVVGVSEGYQKKLEIIGVGYKAEKKGKNLVLSLGFSHPVELQDPEGIFCCRRLKESDMVAISKACPGGGFPSQAPACALVPAQEKR